MAKRSVKKQWNRRLSLERFEERVNPDASFGWEVISAPAPAGISPGLYFRVDGDTSGQGIVDNVSVQNNSTTNVINIVINSSSADDPGVPLDYFLSISAGEIALAQGVFGASFKGFHVLTYDGNDTVGALGVPFSMFIEGGAGNDNLTGGSVNDRIDGGTGGPTVGGVVQAQDTINGSSGSDVIIAGDGDDNINAGSGNDNVDAGTGNDTVQGGVGNDTITGGAGNDNITAGPASVTSPNTDDDTVDAGTGNDTVVGGAGNDSLTGGDGNDNIDGGVGNDSITGGIGDDTITAGDGNDTVDAGDGNDNVDGGAGNDNLVGGPGNDTITGGAGADSIDAGAGNDIVNADTDDVALQGGAGTDTLNLVVGSQPNLAPIIDRQNDGFEVDNIALAANVTFAPSTADFTASPQPNFSAILNAGDTLSFQNAPVGQTINMNSLPFGLGSAGITSVIGSPFNDFITGTAGNDTISAGAGNDNVFAGAGDDTVNGGDGNDNLQGQAGNDILTGGLGDDVINGGTGDDRLVIEWAAAQPNNGLNPNDQFLGLDGVDTLVFVGVPDADGVAGNGVQPSAANLAFIYNYIAVQNAANKMDWGAGDNNDLVFI